MQYAQALFLAATQLRHRDHRALKYDQACKAIKTLEDILVRLEKSRSSDIKHEDFVVNRDATIQRFEYSVDLFWKYLKRSGMYSSA